MVYILLLLGFVLLLRGANLLVDGAASLAQRLGVSTIMIGLTVVAFGTSLPELVVNLMATLQGRTDLALSNVLGSNIANILFILGITTWFYPLTVQSGTIWKEIPFSILVVVVLAILANDSLWEINVSTILHRGDGLILLSFFGIFLVYTHGLAQMGMVAKTHIPSQPLGKSMGAMILGFVGLVLGGQWIVEGAVVLATTLGLGERLVGLTVVAIGTSLPELVTSLVAARKEQYDIAVGNAIGSNIFNVLWILGISSLIHPLSVGSETNQDIAMIVFASGLLFLLLALAHQPILKRRHGVVFILLYVAYLSYQIFTI
jgi:cation:H+ antiporter